MRADVAANGRDSEDSDSRVSQAALVSRVSPAGQQPRASRISVARTSVRPRRIPRGISFFLGGVAWRSFRDEVPLRASALPPRGTEAVPRLVGCPHQ